MAELTEAKQQQRTMWAMGDYPSAAEQIAEVGPRTVEAASITGDDSVLDVACGAGNATIPAAKTGANTTGLDLTPELLEAARKIAAEEGVEIDWIEGDAEQLPFDDASFDAVTSVFGCMFAPDHKAAAAEIARVLKPGGRIAVAAWRPDGAIGKFFMTVGQHMPPPPEGFQPPILWGSEDHAREIFEGTGVELTFETQAVDFVGDEGEGPEEFLADIEQKLPPIVAAKAALEPQGKWDALRADVLALYEENNVSDGDEYRAPAEYLVIKGTKAA
ncbi:MAG: class I SAM-dependent methyltransferase [Solirubrobacterales bacterium]